MKRKAMAKGKARRKVLPIPKGFHTLTPYLVVRDAPKAVEFYEQAFGAKVKDVHYTPDGKVMNAQLQIGDSAFMLNDEFPMASCVSPQTLNGSTIALHLYVKDVDKVFNQAVAAGAKATMPLMDAFWGDRYGQLQDPFGHRWSLATHKEDLSSKEVRKRGQAVFGEMAKKAQSGN